MVRPVDVLPRSYASFLRAAPFTYGLRRKDRKFDGMNVWETVGQRVEVRFYMGWKHVKRLE